MIEIIACADMSEISAQDWDACAGATDGQAPPNPFVTHRFLSALERSRSVGHGTGWQPHHLIAKQDGLIIGAMPLYAKSHSQGEYIFDHSWAHAYENAGGHYYPKLQAAVPFTPVTGPRLLARTGHEATARAALVQGAVQLASQNDVSGLHITFCTADEQAAGEAMGLLARRDQQFHWRNEGYADFDGFLATLSSRKRKNIRKERATAQGFGGTITAYSSDAIRPEHWDAFWTFYQDTGARKWGTPYLTRAFFDEMHATMRDDVLLVLAERDGQPVAGALNFIGADALFGRYWGCTQDHPCLHFELCYYQAIDYAIAKGLLTVEAGAQGQHKLARGYLPTPVYSLHWIADAGLRRAIADYLEQERRAVDQEIDILTGYGPFKRMTGEDHD